MQQTRREDGGEVLWVGALEIRPADHLALADGRTLPLSVRELALLAALARHEGRIVSREELYAVVWGRPFRKEERSVDVYVRRLSPLFHTRATDR
jgi:DNA-binding response OmpR family regulator